MQMNSGSVSVAMLYPPFAEPRHRLADDDSLPSIDGFLDEMPSIQDFIAADESESREDLPSIDDFAPSDFDSEGWAISGWQKFDWAGVASLRKGTTESSEANASWNEGDWNDHGVHRGGTHEVHEPTADEVAMALNEIAMRIRSGELSIDQFHGTPPEAAMAAALAAMLKMRG